ncbi:DNA sulfur modification protein DndD [Nocardia brasiliensis ATCC 700358]|uniref:DNA sulfur modification protein DndD n=1 Tax=Nocardia brasiliensis (strain ATCC 700358 / HUJEG-1) TaxID=1133849 RepID=K0ESZ7_NOCB7|nr:DNA sulfur modification protein DndD [Nocardia brasiliensis ATCC 700358]
MTIEFSTIVDGEPRIFEVSRQWRVTGKSVREFVAVLVDGVYSKVSSEGWADHVEDILSLEVASLFFFDGEKIETLADPDRASSVIESAVHSLLGVNAVEQLRTDLLALQRRQRRTDEDDKRTLERIAELQRERDAAESDSDRAYQEAGSVRAQLSSAKARLTKANNAFVKEGGELFRRRTELELTHTETKNKLKAVEDELRGLAAGALPLALLTSQIEAVRMQASREQESANAAQVGEVLAHRDKWLLELLGETLPTTELTSLRRKLSTDRKKRSDLAAVDPVLRLSKEAFDELATVDRILDHEHTQASNLLAQQEDLARNLEDLARQLTGVPDEKAVADVLNARDDAMRNIATLESKERALTDTHARSRHRLEQLDTELDRAHKARVEALLKTEDTTRIISYSERARATLEQFGDALLKRHISRLEVAMLDSFTQLMRKDRLVQDLRIDTEQFTLTLIGADGEPMPSARLSAGERQLLAIALLWGLARVAGNQLPTVIDTPLGRLDSRHREHLVERYFPHVSHQVLLLSTDEEIDEYLLSKLEPAVAHTYTLVHDDQELITRIEPGYWWNAGASHVA